jgi:hypothetical protein
MVDATLSPYINNDELASWDTEHVDRLISIIIYDLIHHVNVDPNTLDIVFTPFTPDFRFSTDAIREFIEESGETYDLDKAFEQLYTFNWDSIIFKNINGLRIYLTNTFVECSLNDNLDQETEIFIDSSQMQGNITLREFIGNIFRLKRNDHAKVIDSYVGSIISEENPGYLKCEIEFLC